MSGFAGSCMVWSGSGADEVNVGGSGDNGTGG